LTQRTTTGGYVVPDSALVLAIRAFHARGLTAPRDELFTLLLQRSMGMFRKMARGLQHRPEWVEDAIAEMTEQLWKEVLDPKEVFMAQNFGTYLKRLGADHFKGVLRREGYGYRVNEQGQVTGRPEHVPAVLIDSLDRAPGADDEESAAAAGIADTNDTLDKRMAALEAQRILRLLPDPLDRKIFYLRVFYTLKWDEIADQCGMSERTMRSRFEQARETLAAALAAARQPDVTDSATRPPTDATKPTRGRKKGTHA
jgi:RNA polymerase sigma factor (sigma-70 family)